MKTERRHEMQTNVLADWLGHSIEQTRPYAKLLAFGLLAIVLLIAAGMFFLNDQSARLSAGWADFFAASHEANPERLRAVAADHSGTAASVWARLSEADIELAQGMRLLYTDRSSATAVLKDARESYQAVIEQASEPRLRNAARFGLAQTYECLADIDKAIEAYESVGSESSALQAEAEERIAALRNPERRDFYDWFAKQEPVPRNLSGANPGMPSGFPSNLDLLSDQPDLSFPNDFGSGLGSTSEPPAGGEETAAPTDGGAENNDASPTRASPSVNEGEDSIGSPEAATSSSAEPTP